MTDYYKLYDYCKKTYETKNNKRQQIFKNRQTRLKKELFNTIINEAYDKIKENAEEGFDYAVIYDNEYNELIYGLMDSISHHFKPFNVLYKKKTEMQRGFLEVLKDESNYIIIVDWKSKNVDDIPLNNIPLNNIIYNNISELPTQMKQTLNKQTLNKQNQTDLDDECISTEETVTDIINETINDTVIKMKEEEKIIKNLGFEPIF